MSNKLFIKNFKLGNELNNQNLCLSEIRELTDRNGNPYFLLTLQDKTGQIRGNLWSDNIGNNNLSALKPGDVVKVNAKVEEFNNELKLNILKVEKTDDYDKEDFLKKTKKDIEKMWKEFGAKIKSIENKNLREVLTNIFKDKEIRDKFKTWPAAEMVHHDYIGGLLEHTLEMLNFAEDVCKAYPIADKDLVTAGIILHDIGKIDEIKINGFAITKSTEGRLLGHIALGLKILDKFTAKGFPQNLKEQISHIIVSHHGEAEFGSPVKPMTIEAAIVHYVDMISSRVKQYEKAIEEFKDSEEDFTPWKKWIETQVYLPPVGSTAPALNQDKASGGVQRLL